MRGLYNTDLLCRQKCLELLEDFDEEPLIYLESARPFWWLGCHYWTCLPWYAALSMEVVGFSWTFYANCLAKQLPPSCCEFGDVPAESELVQLRILLLPSVSSRPDALQVSDGAQSEGCHPHRNLTAGVSRTTRIMVPDS